MRAALVLLPLLLLAPAALALPELAGEEVVSAHTTYEYATGRVCSSYDPALGVASTDLTSRLAHEASGGVTTYALRLDGAVGDAACPAWALTFESDLAWPEIGAFAGGSVASDCGASGVIQHFPASSRRQFGIFFVETPAACALPFSAPAWVQFGIQPVVADGMVCTPVVFAGCTGVDESSAPYGCPGSMDRVSVLVAGFEVVYGRHGCEWPTMEEYGQVGDGFSVVYVRGTESGCTVVVGSAVGLDQSAPCPEPVGDAVYEQDWHAILP